MCKRTYIIDSICAVYKWVPLSSDSTLPSDAVQAGYDIDGSKIYIGRAIHEDHQIIAKVIPSKQVAYVAWGGKEHSIHQFEVALLFRVQNWFLFFKNYKIGTASLR